MIDYDSHWRDMWHMNVYVKTTRLHLVLWVAVLSVIEIRNYVQILLNELEWSSILRAKTSQDELTRWAKMSQGMPRGCCTYLVGIILQTWHNRFRGHGWTNLLLSVLSIGPFETNNSYEDGQFTPLEQHRWSWRAGGRSVFNEQRDPRDL